MRSSSASLIPESVVRRGRISPTRIPSIRASTPIRRKGIPPNTPYVQSEPPIVNLSGANANVHTVVLLQRGVSSHALDLESLYSTNASLRPKSPGTWATSSVSSYSTTHNRRNISTPLTDDGALTDIELHESSKLRAAIEKPTIGTPDDWDLQEIAAKKRQLRESNSRPASPSRNSDQIGKAVLPPISSEEMSINALREELMKEFPTLFRINDLENKLSPRPDATVNFDGTSTKPPMVIDTCPSPTSKEVVAYSPTLSASGTQVGSPTSKSDRYSPDREILYTVVPPEQRKSNLQYILYHTRPKYNIAVMAGRRKFDKVVIAVKEYPPCVSDKEEDGSTALHHATIYNEESVVKVLLGYGADPNALEVAHI